MLGSISGLFPGFVSAAAGGGVAPSPMDAPPNVDINQSTLFENTVNVSWTAPASSPNGYRIRVYKFSDDTLVSNTTVLDGVLDTEVGSLTIGTQYYATVTTLGDGTTSSDSTATRSNSEAYPRPVEAGQPSITSIQSFNNGSSFEVTYAVGSPAADYYSLEIFLESDLSLLQSTTQTYATAGFYSFDLSPYLGQNVFVRITPIGDTINTRDGQYAEQLSTV